MFPFPDADPPSLEIQPPTGLVLARKGDAVVLTCVADKDPTRAITWETRVIRSFFRRAENSKVSLTFYQKVRWIFKETHLGSHFAT